MQKRLLSMMLIVVLALVVGIVGAQDDPYADVDPTGATITYWHEWDGAQGEGMTAIIDMFNESNEWGITVEQNALGGSRDVQTNVSTAITSGDTPNLSGAVFGNDAMGYYLDGVLLPLDVFLDSPTWGLSEEERAELNFGMIDINRIPIAPFDGQLLAWPIGLSGDVMSVNLSALADMQAQGLIDFEGAPTTFEQFRAAACAASELEGVTAGYAARPTGSELYSIIWNFGGEVFDAEAGVYSFTNDGAIAALQFLQDLYNDGCYYFPEGSYQNTGDFSLGLNIMAVGSSVGVPFIQGDMDEAGNEYEWINTTLPWVEGARTVETSPRSVGILTSTPEENLATWLFIKYFSTLESQIIWTEAANYQPINTAVIDSLTDGFPGSAQFFSFAEVLADPDVAIRTFPPHPRAGDIAYQVASELYSNVTIGGMDVMESAMAAEEEANAIYQEDLENISDA